MVCAWNVLWVGYFQSVFAGLIKDRPVCIKLSMREAVAYGSLPSLLLLHWLRPGWDANKRRVTGYHWAILSLTIGAIDSLARSVSWFVFISEMVLLETMGCDSCIPGHPDMIITVIWTKYTVENVMIAAKQIIPRMMHTIHVLLWVVVIWYSYYAISSMVT